MPILLDRGRQAHEEDRHNRQLTRSFKGSEPLGLGKTLARTVAHFFPELSVWLKETQDRRDPELITYPRQFLLWMGLMGFLLKVGSRRQVRFELDSPAALANLNRLARAGMKEMAHSDTLNDFLGRVPPASLERLRRRMIHRLVRMKALDRGRLLGHFLVVLDATGHLYFRQRHQVNAFQCHEERGKKTKLFAWLTNWSVSSETVVSLANLGGRCRWKIENEAFNIQKNGGFNLEHAYSTGEWQIKNFYVLMQIAHLLLQLIERGSLLTREAQKLFGSLRGMARRLLESIRNIVIPADAIDLALAAKIQIRLNSS